jgi:hypothetical protein
MTLESQAVETDPFPFTHISETRGDAHANLRTALLFLDMAISVWGIFTSKSYVTRFHVGGPYVRRLKVPVRRNRTFLPKAYQIMAWSL